MKTILASITAVALLALAACDDGTQAPQSGAGDQTGAIETAPATTPAEPADTGTDTVQ